jgi:hypothetical protein
MKYAPASDPGGDPLAHPSPTLTLVGLSRSERADLLERLPNGSAEVRQADLAAGELGEPGTAILLIALSVVALAGICSWLSSKGKDVKLSLQVQAPGISGGVCLEITGTDTPTDVEAKLAEQGVTVPEG